MSGIRANTSAPAELAAGALFSTTPTVDVDAASSELAMRSAEHPLNHKHATATAHHCLIGAQFPPRPDPNTRKADSDLTVRRSSPCLVATRQVHRGQSA